MSATCYALGGRTYPSGTQYIPCDPGAVANGVHSACCAPGDLCLTNGLCKNPEDEKQGFNHYFRNGCTDSSWKDPACPKFCGDIDPEDPGHLIFNCLKKESWCCANGGPMGSWPNAIDPVNTTCCSIDDLTFQAADPVYYTTAKIIIGQTSIDKSSSTIFNTISQATSLASIAPDATTTPSVQATTAPSQGFSGSSSALKVGLGVGISLGAVIVAAIGVIIWLIRRKKMRARDSGNWQGYGYGDGHELVYKHQQPPSYFEASADQQAQELPGRHDPIELHGEPREVRSN